MWNFIILWSEQLSSSQISQFVKSLSSSPFTMVRSILLFSRPLWNVVQTLSSFIIYRLLLIIYSSIVFPLLLLWVSCQAADRALLSTTITYPIPLESSSIYSTFSSSLSMSPVLSKYILTAKNLVSLYSSSRSTMSVLDSCVTSTASIFLLGLLWRPGFWHRGRCRCYLKLILRPFCGCTDRVLVWICWNFLVRLVSLICRSQAWSVGDLFACTLWVPVFCLCYVNS